jgi:hypothetical protein
MALRPDYATAHSNLLFALNYRADLPAETIFAKYRNGIAGTRYVPLPRLRASGVH